MVALGSKCLVGDQLHPNGAINHDTYASIAPAYERIEKLEPYLKGARQELRDRGALGRALPSGRRPQQRQRRRRRADAARAEVPVRRGRQHGALRGLPTAHPARRHSGRGRSGGAPQGVRGGRRQGHRLMAVGARFRRRLRPRRRHHPRRGAGHVPPGLHVCRSGARSRHDRIALRRLRGGRDDHGAKGRPSSASSYRPISTGPTPTSARTRTRRTIPTRRRSAPR